MNLYVLPVSLFFPEKSFLEQSGKSVEIIVVEHFWKVFHPIQIVEEISEAKLRKYNLVGVQER